MIVAAVLAAIALGNYATAVLFLLINVFGARELCYVLEEEKTPILNMVYMFLGVISFFLMYLLDLGFGINYQALIIISCVIMLGLIINLWLSIINFGKIRYAFALLYWGLPFSLASYFLIYGGQEVQFIIFGIITLIMD